MISSAVRFQIARVKNNLFTFLCIVLTALVVLYAGYRHDTLKQAVAYLFVMWLCSFFVDVYAIKKPAQNDFIVRNPKRETTYFFLCLCGGVLFFLFRFSGIMDWEHAKPLLKLAVVPLIVFVFPIALAVIMLLLKYKPRDLGLRLQGLILIIPIIAISAITNRLVSPQSLTWNAVLAEEGSVAATLFSGLIVAGLSEEFFRTIGQTRLGALLHNKGMGFVSCSEMVWRKPSSCGCAFKCDTYCSYRPDVGLYHSPHKKFSACNNCSRY
jgi:hypothetical protein